MSIINYQLEPIKYHQKVYLKDFPEVNLNVTIFDRFELIK